MEIPFSFEPSAEQIEQMKLEFAKRVAFRNDIRHMLASLDTHHLWVLKGMMNGIVNADEGQARVGAGHFAGMLIAHLDMRGVCSSCGVDHFDQDMVEVDPETKPQQGPPPEEQIIDQTEVESDIQSTLDEYKVKEDPTTDQPNRVRCTGPCGGLATWPSLDNRMDERPNICPMCADKDKWG